MSSSKPTKTGVLYSCATPIGNFEDCSERLKSTLIQVGLVAAEDTRVAKLLMAHCNAGAPLISLHDFNEDKQVGRIKRDLDNGIDVALISDAGTPNISDPGAHLIDQLSSQGYLISPIPGPSAITALLSVVGLRSDQFCFGGFFPKKDSQKTQALKNINEMPHVFFESPKRITATILWCANAVRQAEFIIAKEVSKKHETIIRGNQSNIVEKLKECDERGEWLFCIKGQLKDSENTLEKDMGDMHKLGLSWAQVDAINKRFKCWNKNEAYDAFLKEKKND